MSCVIRTFVCLSIALLFAACGGADSPKAKPTTAPAPTQRPAEPTATLSDQYGVVALPSLPAPRTVRSEPANELIEAPSKDDNAYQLLFYNPATAALTAIRTAPGFVPWAWTSRGEAIFAAEGGLALYEPRAGTVRRVVLDEPVVAMTMGPGTRVALRLGDPLQVASQSFALLDLATLQLQPVALNALPSAWSPDGKRLLVGVFQPGPAVLLLDTPTPRLYTLPTPLGGRIAGWVSDTSLLQLMSRNATTIDISGPSPRMTMRPFASDQVSVHKGAVRLAANNKDARGITVSVSIYDALSLQKQRDVPGASLGQSLEVSDTIWSSDSSKVLLTTDECLPTERIILYDVRDGRSTDVAKVAPPFGMALSADAKQVAYIDRTTLYVVPTDGSTTPRLVFGRVAGKIAWSPDSATVGFPHFSGGSGRCEGFGNR